MTTYSLCDSGSSDDDDGSVYLKSGESSEAKASVKKGKIIDSVNKPAKTPIRRSARIKSTRVKTSSGGEVYAINLVSPKTPKRKSTSNVVANSRTQRRSTGSSRRNVKSASNKAKDEDDIPSRTLIGKHSVKDKTPKKAQAETGADPKELESILDAKLALTAITEVNGSSQAEGKHKHSSPQALNKRESIEQTNAKANTATSTKVKIRMTPAASKTPLIRGFAEREETHFEGDVQCNFDDANQGDPTASPGAARLLATPFNCKKQSISNAVSPALTRLIEEHSPIEYLGDVEENAAISNNCDKFIKTPSVTPKKHSCAGKVAALALPDYFSGDLNGELKSQEAEATPSNLKDHSVSKDSHDVQEVVVTVNSHDEFSNQPSSTPTKLLPYGELGEEHSAVEDLDGLREHTVVATNCDELIKQPLATPKKPMPEGKVAASALFAAVKSSRLSTRKKSKGDRGIEGADAAPSKECDGDSNQPKKVDFALPNLMSKDLWEMNMKSLPVEEGAAKDPEGLASSCNENYKLLDAESVGLNKEETLTKKRQLLDLSYQKAGVHAVRHARATPFSSVHDKRVMLILDNPARAEELIAMCIRNNKDIEMMELMRHFDYFSV